MWMQVFLFMPKCLFFMPCYKFISLLIIKLDCKLTYGYRYKIIINTKKGASWILSIRLRGNHCGRSNDSNRGL